MELNGWMGVWLPSTLSYVYDHRIIGNVDQNKEIWWQTQVSVLCQVNFKISREMYSFFRIFRTKSRPIIRNGISRLYVFQVRSRLQNAIDKVTTLARCYLVRLRCRDEWEGWVTAPSDSMEQPFDVDTTVSIRRRNEAVRKEKKNKYFRTLAR